jgi:DNA-binding transcriptional MerR regulator
MTVTELTRACGLSRSTVLYYESIGLLRQVRRTAGNYRAYGDADLERLRLICVYRTSGLKLADIRGLLDRPQHDAAAILEQRLREINREIARLREHERAIGRLLKATGKLRRNKMITKQKWTDIMRAAGLSDDDMHRWHVEFEKSAPAEHQEFLEFLHIPAEEVKSIREWSRGGKR